MQSIADHGQLQAGIATEDLELIVGTGRYLALKGLGRKTMRVKVILGHLSETKKRLITATENLDRQDLTGWDIYSLCREILELNPGWLGKDLAEHLHKDPSWVTRALSPSKCTPAWQDALKAGKVTLSHCYATSKLDQSEQDGLLALKLSGQVGSRDGLERERRKKRNGEAPAVRMSRIKIALPGKINLIISGREMSMAQLVDLLGEVTKEARKAAEQYDVRTFQSMMRDRAK